MATFSFGVQVKYTTVKLGYIDNGYKEFMAITTI